MAHCVEVAPMPDSFAKSFEILTGNKPFPWQEELAKETSCRTRVIRIPTGFGKTQGTLAAWGYHRINRQDDLWPRRLIWCLPMRVLVEQTEQVANQFFSTIPVNQRPEVHVLMGGKDVGDWFLSPEKNAVIIGTQDMLLSRALNRGYGSGRARWPQEFGLLNHDALWVMDEVQLMDVGLATSAQIQAYREQDQAKSFRPCHTWWMSATFQANWLSSVDTISHHAGWITNPCIIPSSHRMGHLWDVEKSLVCDGVDPNDNKSFASAILQKHDDIPTKNNSRITLVVCNTVDRACATYDALKASGRKDELELVHSRFRPAERETWRDRFLSRESCTGKINRIIVATQVVEAGVDISADCLITELAPWPSLVQRFGRCARYGGYGQVTVVDRRGEKGQTAPYTTKELESAWESIQGMKDVGISALERLEESLDTNAKERLYPFSPAHLLLRSEFDELFDTTPDLTGADLDISRFIRSGDEKDLQVFWLDLPKDETPPAKRHPHRRELCSVPFLMARDWLCGEETISNRKPKLRGGIRAWVWDWIEGEWSEANRASLFPGRNVCVDAACGGYRPGRGFDPDSKGLVPPVALSLTPQENQEADAADDQQDGEQLSFNPWKTIGCHSAEVATEAKEISTQLGLPTPIKDTLALAAWWHDWGKAHPAFQGAMQGIERPESNSQPKESSSKGLPKPPKVFDRPHCTDLAKGPDNAWRKGPYKYKYLDNSDSRPAFRHELASALGLIAILQNYAPHHPALLGPWLEVLAQMGRSPLTKESLPVTSPLVQRLLDCSSETFDLLVYLVASHHGKVRVALHAAPKDQEYRDRDGRGLPIRGVREGDRLPPTTLVPGEPALPEVTLTLAPASLGISPNTGISWRERSQGVMERHGQTGLAFLEALLRAADVRASRLKTNDPALPLEATP